MTFTSVAQVKARIAELGPSVCHIAPHHSASYLWAVWHPPSFGRLLYGFSTTEGLLAWANSALA